MTPWEERDMMTAGLIRREIDACKARAKEFGWKPNTPAWNRAFGEISGLHRALELIDPNARDVMPYLPQSLLAGQG